MHAFTSADPRTYTHYRVRARTSISARELINYTQRQRSPRTFTSADPRTYTHVHRSALMNVHEARRCRDLIALAAPLRIYPVHGTFFFFFFFAYVAFSRRTRSALLSIALELSDVTMIYNYITFLIGDSEFCLSL